ncbi:uncharacterized protein (DUF849 family) [Neorhizobium sp. 2083]|uniref:3-keto-5-aminohexanoate cleavage protein n=1 Tax=Neorhizobium sp. 2083 TaxID=2817762 RepID=UPI0028583F40|nr:3-keto-5-aminohexanoate cleavage protein [Neorhizobium sp. 2083]MDR6816416.1 uncharacterized protein (DUF849 family) [Neorhizobium sp. 2083]
MKRKVILTCAVTGGSALSKNSQYVPITPEAIADEAIRAARAGAASVHIHVRDPQTGAPSMKFELYDEVMQRIRRSGSDVIINLTAGPGAGYAPPLDETAAPPVRSPEVRTHHVSRLRPDICTLDVATMNFGDRAIVNTPPHLIAMAQMIRAAGVKPELEVFDIGHVGVAVRLLEAGHLPKPPFFQFCLGIPGGAPATTEAMLLMRSLLPPGTIWSAFGISRFQMPMVAQSVILGGHCRVGLEDNLYLEQGVLAEGNEPLVQRAVEIIRALGAEPATPSEAREILSLEAARAAA